MDFSPGSIAALVTAIAFAAGLNVYATITMLGLMARLHWVALPAGLESLGHTWVVAVAAALFFVEVFADKVPGLDLAWNAAHTFIRVPLAALMAYKAASPLSPEMRLVATLAGAAIAAVAHSSKTAARVLVTPSPEPVSNIALSAGEDVGALGLTWLAVHRPYAAGGIAAALLVAAVLSARWIIRQLKAIAQRLRGSAPAAQPTAAALSTARNAAIEDRRDL